MSCKFTKPDGTACRMRARTGTDFCFWHTPGMDRQRKEARRRGGRAGERLTRCLPEDAADLVLDNADDVRAALSEAYNQTRRGQLGVKTAASLAQLGRVLLKSIELGELAREVEKIKRLLKEQAEQEQNNGYGNGRFDRW